MVNIKGLNKAEVLSTLFNNSKIQGFNYQMVARGLMDYPKPITKDEAQVILNGMNEEKYFDYLNGKVMKINLTSNDEFDEWGYDRDNGDGTAQRAIDGLKNKLGVK